MRIAISGHRGLPDDTALLIDQAIRDELIRHPSNDLTGISCLADGADQIFARAVLDAGGRLEVVVPAEKYRDGLPADSLTAYDELLARASGTHRLSYTESTSESHMDASRRMLGYADQLIAVWDGQPARGYGGTADVVKAARDLNVRVTIVWPDGARRD